MIPNRLNFKLPYFNRITWASEKLQNKWEHMITHFPQIIDKVYTSKEIIDTIPIQIKSISINELYNYKKQINLNGFFADNIDILPSALMLYFGLRNKKNKSYVIIGQRQNVIRFIKGIKELDYDIILNHLHPETFYHWDRYLQNDFFDTMWGLLNKIDDQVTTQTTQSNTLLNPCWIELGISSIPFNPQSLNCKHSIKIANIIKSYAKEVLSDEIYNAWYEILSWPVEWSALHGIAEVKTPIFKMIYNTDATCEKYVLQLESESYPENGLKGLMFPYKKPSKLYFTDSRQNKAGINHLTTTLNLKKI